MRTLNDLFRYAECFLQKHGIEDSSFEAKELVVFASGTDRGLFSLNLQNDTNEQIWVQVENMLHQRVNGMPLQYLIGEWDFYANTFRVMPGVLIPRPETEELTDIAISFIKKNGSKIIYDICAGTGCIGLSVAIACPEAEVYLFELHDQPLHCIRINTEKYGLKNVHILECDVLQEMHDNIPAADVMISNPPYIPTAAIQELQREVLNEPLTALDGGNDGLVFYRAIADKWFHKLNAGGSLFFECAEDQTDVIADMFVSKHSDIEYAYSLKDFYGLDRFVQIKRKDC